MKQHQYKVKTEWTGNQGSGTSDYKSYSRSHLISVEGKSAEILGSSDPSFRGDATRYNPEELFVSSISTCHMLWYLHLCASNHIVVTSYIDHAKGTMEESKDGSGRFKKVVLYPNVTISNNEQLALANELHAQAHKMCFIANSCNFKIGHEPTTLAEDLSNA